MTQFWVVKDQESETTLTLPPTPRIILGTEGRKTGRAA